MCVGHNTCRHFDWVSNWEKYTALREHQVYVCSIVSAEDSINTQKLKVWHNLEMSGIKFRRKIWDLRLEWEADSLNMQLVEMHRTKRKRGVMLGVEEWGQS